MASSSTAATPLLYSCIAYKSTILSEHTTSAASATSGLASVVLPKIDHSSAEKRTYVHGNNNIHYIADAAPASSDSSSLSAPGLTYLVVAPSDLGRRIPFGYLLQCKNDFLAKFPPDTTNFAGLPAYGAASFNTSLKKLMVDFGTSKAGQEDAFRNVQREIDDVRGIMTENIERVLERGERIDLLVDKTDRLGGSARDFRMRSKGLRRRMFWKNIRLMVLLGVVCVFLLYLLIGFGCGLPGKVPAHSSSTFANLHSVVKVHPKLVQSVQVQQYTPYAASSSPYPALLWRPTIRGLASLRTRVNINRKSRTGKIAFAAHSHMLQHIGLLTVILLPHNLLLLIQPILSFVPAS